MTVTTTAHIGFRGDARAALGFYQSVFGGNAAISTHGQPQPCDWISFVSPKQAT